MGTALGPLPSNSRCCVLTVAMVDFDAVATIGPHEYAAAIIAAGFRRPHHRRADRVRYPCLGPRMIVNDEENAGLKCQAMEPSSWRDRNMTERSFGVRLYANIAP